MHDEHAAAIEAAIAKWQHLGVQAHGTTALTFLTRRELDALTRIEDRDFGAVTRAALRRRSTVVDGALRPDKPGNNAAFSALVSALCCSPLTLAEIVEFRRETEPGWRQAHDRIIAAAVQARAKEATGASVDALGVALDQLPLTIPLALAEGHTRPAHKAILTHLATISTLQGERLGWDENAATQGQAALLVAAALLDAPSTQELGGLARWVVEHANHVSVVGRTLFEYRQTAGDQRPDVVATVPHLLPSELLALREGREAPTDSLRRCVQWRTQPAGETGLWPLDPGLNNGFSCVGALAALGDAAEFEQLAQLATAALAEFVDSETVRRVVALLPLGAGDRWLTPERRAVEIAAAIGGKVTRARETDPQPWLRIGTAEVGIMMFLRRRCNDPAPEDVVGLVLQLRRRDRQAGAPDTWGIWPLDMRMTQPFVNWVRCLGRRNTVMSAIDRFVPGSPRTTDSLDEAGTRTGWSLQVMPPQALRPWTLGLIADGTTGRPCTLELPLGEAEGVVAHALVATLNAAGAAPIAAPHRDALLERLEQDLRSVLDATRPGLDVLAELERWLFASLDECCLPAGRDEPGSGPGDIAARIASAFGSWCATRRYSREDLPARDAVLRLHGTDEDHAADVSFVRVVKTSLDAAIVTLRWRLAARLVAFHRTAWGIKDPTPALVEIGGMRRRVPLELLGDAEPPAVELAAPDRRTARVAIAIDVNPRRIDRALPAPSDAGAKEEDR